VTGSPRILFVDDEPAIVESFIFAARFAGVEAEGFTQPSEALARFRAEPGAFRAIITDFTMADMGCVDFIARVRAIRADMPVHICTGNAEHDIAEAVRGLAVGRILFKPFDFDELERFLRDILGLTG
jgi:DNA-binding NtrC family response regulator